MLVRFSVGNFLSFKDIQEFSMIKGKPQNKSERLFETSQIKLLKFAAVFGANASGKSNLVSSMKFAQMTILHGMPSRGKISPFRLDNESLSKPSYFEFEIVIDGKNYSYGFEVFLDTKQYVSEWLVELLSSGKNKVIFERDIQNGTIESNFTISTEDNKTKYKVYSDDIAKNRKLLFLTVMNREKEELYKEPNEFSIFQRVYQWFADILDVNYPERPISDYSYFRDTDNKAEICRVIRCLGTGITNFVEQRSSLEQLRSDLPKKVVEKIEEDINNVQSEKGGKLTLTIRSGSMYYMVLVDGEDIAVTTIAFEHGTTDLFGFREESDGTRRILDLIEILLSNNEKVYIIDEIDRSLHPQMTFKFVQEFLKAAKARNIQLIITTHESALMDFGLLRQDEIWIADKNNVGATALYSLDEYNVRFDKKVAKAYLEGRYGGVPIFSSIFPINEEAK